VYRSSAEAPYGSDEDEVVVPLPPASNRTMLRAHHSSFARRASSTATAGMPSRGAEHRTEGTATPTVPMMPKVRLHSMRRVGLLSSRELVPSTASSRGAASVLDGWVGTVVCVVALARTMHIPSPSDKRSRLLLCCGVCRAAPTFTKLFRFEEALRVCVAGEHVESAASERVPLFVDAEFDEDDGDGGEDIATAKMKAKAGKAATAKASASYEIEEEEEVWDELPPDAIMESCLSRVAGSHRDGFVAWLVRNGCAHMHACTVRSNTALERWASCWEVRSTNDKTPRDGSIIARVSSPRTFAKSRRGPRRRRS
jgi:hypothetical protein